jgi:hypothetical protein
MQQVFDFPAAATSRPWRDLPSAQSRRLQHHAGKVNPVIPEVVNQVAFEVIGYDLAITMAAEAGQLQLNAFEPLIEIPVCEQPSPAKCSQAPIAHFTTAVKVLREEPSLAWMERP